MILSNQCYPSPVFYPLTDYMVTAELINTTQAAYGEPLNQTDPYETSDQIPRDCT